MDKKLIKWVKRTGVFTFAIPAKVGQCRLWLCVCFSNPDISDQRVSISKLVRINEGRTARLKCYTQNVPNVTVSVFQLSSNIDNSMLNRVHFSIQSNFNLWVVWHGVLF